jgi:hypothetical protein
MIRAASATVAAVTLLKIALTYFQQLTEQFLRRPRTLTLALISACDLDVRRMLVAAKPQLGTTRVPGLSCP